MTDEKNEDFEARQRLLAVFKTPEARKSEDLDIAAAASAIEVPAPRADTAEMEAKLGGQVDVLDVSSPSSPGARCAISADFMQVWIFI